MMRNRLMEVEMPDYAPGWYPQQDGSQRYWDGAGWTDQVISPAGFAPNTQPVVGTGTAGATAAPGSQPAAKGSRPWYKRKRVLIPGAALVLIIGVSAAGGGHGGQPQNAAVPASSASVSATTSTDEPAETTTGDGSESAEPTSNAYDESFGTFAVVSKSGRGDAIIKLPSGASAGLVTLTHSGSSNFVAEVLDKHNKSTGDLLVNEIGAYSGTTAFGFGMTDGGVKIKLMADGHWTARIAPISSAPKLGASASGKGDKVLLYDGEGGDFKITHNGRSNFVVNQQTGELPNLAVNEIGKYSGVVPLEEGPSVVLIKADGKWSATEQ
jgi:hypothetical protein